MKNESPIIQICPCYVDLEHETGGVANIVRQICLQLVKQRKHVLLLCGNRELGKVKASPGCARINDFLTVEILDQKSHPLLGPTNELTNAHIVPSEYPIRFHSTREVESSFLQAKLLAQANLVVV
jgi:hypothetical protein